MGAGIDWGNTNTVVAFKVGRGERLFEMDGQPCIPSYMQYNESAELVAIGRQAKNALLAGEGQVFAGLKRLVGTAFDPDVKSWAEGVYGLNLRPGEQGGVLVQVGSQWKSPEQMACEYFRMLLALLQETARETGGWLARLFRSVNMKQCVVTCPVQYLDSQKSALQRSLAKAGFLLKDGRLLPEPAAVCKLLPRRKARDTMIVDWGGGTLDFAFVSADDRCRGLSGVQTGCGGIDMDHAILKALQDRGELPARITPVDRSVAREFVERRKERALSTDRPLPPESAPLPASGRTLELTFQRGDVAKWIEPICIRAQNATDETLYRNDDLNVERCILVGGPFCSDYVRGKIGEVLDEDCEVVLPEGNPMTAVATGACRSIRNGPDGPLVHDYGVMVDLFDHKLGKLLLRGEETCPVTSPAGSFQLRGEAGRGVDITVFARKTNPATKAATYESSSTFQFLPRFQKGQARISVVLEADNGGAISARVTDETTQREMQLHSVSRGICRSMSGPPARSLCEETGFWLMQCWQALLQSGGLSVVATGPDIENDAHAADRMERFVDSLIGEAVPQDTLVTLWQDAVALARDMLARASRAPTRENDLERVWHDVHARLGTADQGTIDESAVRGLLRLLDQLLILVVRAFGKQALAPEMTSCAANGAGGRVRRSLDSLLRLLAGFQGSTDEYETLVSRISEARNDLEKDDAQEPALGTLKRLVELVGERNSPYSELQALWQHLRNLPGGID